MSAPAPVSKRSVLVVEDDPAVKKLILKYLGALQPDLELRHAADGRSAIGMMKEKTPDLVCLDLMLPELSGYNLCEYIRKTPPLTQVPVLMISARNLPTDRAHAEELGANGYLIKPFSRDAFNKAIRGVLPESTP